MDTAAKKMQELYEWHKAWEKYNTTEKRTAAETDKSTERRRVKVRK